MLVVVAIIAVLFALLLPAFQRAQYLARHAACSTNLRQIAVGLITYASDYQRYYPIGSTSGRSVLVPVRATNYEIPDNESFNEAGQYFEGPYDDHRNMTIRNPLFACPQGLREAPWGRPARYIHPPDNWPVDAHGNHLTHSNSRALYSLYPGRAVTYVYESQSDFATLSEVQRTETKLRLGEPLRLKPWRSNSWWTYDNPPLMSDILWAINGGLSTNHLFGGERRTHIHFSPAPMYFWGFDAIGEANYVLEDGSVRQFGGLEEESINDTTNAINQMGVGNDAQRLPKPWGQPD